MKTLFSILILVAMNASAQPDKSSAIEFEDAYSVYITTQLRQSKEFYTRWLDFDVVFEASWFVYMQSKGEHKVSFALIDETHPSTPPSYGAFEDRGSFLTLQVSDAESAYLNLRERGAPVTYPLTREAWGQIRFGLTDPNGLYIDIVQQVEPAAGYWEQYRPEQ